MLNTKGQFENFNFKTKINNKKYLNEKILKQFLIIIFFGYSMCPDLCPKLIEILINKLKILKIFYKLKFIFFSINWKNDNIIITQKYINKYKTKNLYGLTQTLKFIENWTKIFRVIYKYGNYDKIIHSNAIYITKCNKIILINIYKNIYNFIKL